MKKTFLETRGSFWPKF